MIPTPIQPAYDTPQTFLRDAISRELAGEGSRPNDRVVNSPSAEKALL
jgi:hypothetical protein